VSRATRLRSGFRSAFSPVLFLHGLVVAALLTVIWPGLSWPFPPGSARDRLAAAGVAIAAAGIAVLLTRRTPRYKARRELIFAAAARAGGTWLDREAGQTFGVRSRFWPWCRMWEITRIGEADVIELDRDESAGEQLLAYEDFVTLPFTSEVMRLDDVVLIDRETGGSRRLPGGPGVLRSAWRLSRMAKAGTGFVIASPDQVAEVIAQLRAAERIGMQETGDNDEQDS